MTREGSAVADRVNRALLEQLQGDFPLTPRPFAVLGETSGLDEAEVLTHVRDLREAGLIQYIGGIFDMRRLGYQSTLLAFHVPQEALDAAAAQINAHPGVSYHCARPHHYNLWFTLAVPPGQPLAGEIVRLAGQIGVNDWLYLPVLRVFKIKAHFGFEEGDEALSPRDPGGAKCMPRALTTADVPYVRALQQELPLVPRPFAHVSGLLGMSEESLLGRARDLMSTGILRRFGAVVRPWHRGGPGHGLACCVVPEEQVEEVGRLAAGMPQVSQCCERPSHPPRWPYTLFCMIHGQTRDEVEGIAAHVARETGIEEYQVLYTTREFKKERVKYFET
jgi:DNA-binding Lrp family transcriptional regulator